MSDGNGKSPFELEPEPEEPKREAKLPRVYEDPPEPKDVSDVDTRTVAERKGEDGPVGASEAIPPPPGWPAELFSFPLRKPGPGYLAFAGGTLFALDLLRMVDAVAWLGMALQLFALMFILRGMFAVIGTTAAGKDEPLGWSKALEFDADEMWRYFRAFAWLVVLLLPAVIVLGFDLGTGLGLVLLVVGGMYAAVVALSEGLGDRSQRAPWHALRWMATRPLHCFLGFACWLALLPVPADAGGTPGRIAQALLLRFVGAYLLLVSARILGVMGRRWTAA